MSDTTQVGRTDAAGIALVPDETFLRFHDDLLSTQAKVTAFFMQVRDEQARMEAEIKSLREERDSLRAACQAALDDFEQLVNPLTKIARVHPFTQTPALLREALGLPAEPIPRIAAVPPPSFPAVTARYQTTPLQYDHSLDRCFCAGAVPERVPRGTKVVDVSWDAVILESIDRGALAFRIDAAHVNDLDEWTHRVGHEVCLRIGLPDTQPLQIRGLVTSVHGQPSRGVVALGHVRRWEFVEE